MPSDPMQSVMGLLKTHAAATSAGLLGQAVEPAPMATAEDKLDAVFNRDALNSAYVGLIDSGSTVAAIAATKRQIDLIAALDRETSMRYASPMFSILSAASKAATHAASGGTIDIRLNRGATG